MARKATQLTSPEGGIAFGIVLIILSVVILLVPSDRVATQGSAGLLGIPIWILGIPPLLGGIWLLYLGVTQVKKKK
ncbi:hypothetical protein [Clavibacter sp. Sh2088]|uniref:hypothetical protein n=1 Tax=Clavibacter sp. Sh2088 TaxID=3397676 RepID=UPI0039DFDC63